MLSFEWAVVGALILLNGFFAMSELAVVSSRRGRLQQMAQNGNKGARRALRLVEDPTGFLPTVQVGITLVGVLAGAYRSEERRVGKECVRPCRSRWEPYQYKKKKND